MATEVETTIGKYDELCQLQLYNHFILRFDKPLLRRPIDHGRCQILDPGGTLLFVINPADTQTLSKDGSLTIASLRVNVLGEQFVEMRTIKKK